MSAKPIVSPDLIEQFQRDGFVVVDNLLNEEELEKFGAWLRSRGAIPTVVALRQKFEHVRRAELDRLDFKLASLPEEAREAARARVDEITHLIVEKLLLTPTEQLKALGDAETVGAYSEALTKLFGLSDERPERPSERPLPFTRAKRPSSGSGPQGRGPR